MPHSHPMLKTFFLHSESLMSNICFIQAKKFKEIAAKEAAREEKESHTLALRRVKLRTIRTPRVSMTAQLKQKIKEESLWQFKVGELVKAPWVISCEYMTGDHECMFAEEPTQATLSCNQINRRILTIRLSKVWFSAVILEVLPPSTPGKPRCYRIKFSKGNYVSVMKEEQLQKQVWFLVCLRRKSADCELMYPIIVFVSGFCDVNVSN